MHVVPRPILRAEAVDGGRRGSESPCVQDHWAKTLCFFFLNLASDTLASKEYQGEDALDVLLKGLAFGLPG
jgi:hypothetical protein